MHFDFEAYRGTAYFGKTIEVFRSSFNRNIIILLGVYIGIVIFYLIKGNKKERVIMVLYPVMLLIFLLNPWCAWFWNSTFNMYSRFFREFWLVPVIFTFAYFVADIYGRMSGKYVKYVYVGVITFITMLGWTTLKQDTGLLYTGNVPNTGMMKVDNIYKMPNEILDIAKILQESREGDSCYILCDENTYRDIHTYDGSIKVRCFKGGTYTQEQLGGAIEKQQYGSIIDIATSLGSSITLEPKILEKACSAKKIEYIVLPYEYPLYDIWLQIGDVVGTTDNYTVVKIGGKNE